MKHLAISILLSACCLTLCAQKKSIYLLSDFTQGTVLMKNGAKVSSLLNYDAANRKMKYKEKEDVLILINTQEIDTIYIASHKFIPVNRMFLEVVDIPNGQVHVNWYLKELYKGKVGAYGITTQSTTTTHINTSHYNKGFYKREVSDVQETINTNDYWLMLNNKWVKLKDAKSLIRLFPKQEEALKLYLKEQKTDMKNPAQAIDAINYALGLHASTGSH